ncbi:MAG: DUF4846 domain-containing protein [Flavobacteriaceae bacterium]
MMKRALFVVVLLPLVVNACGQGSSSKKEYAVTDHKVQKSSPEHNPDGKTIRERFYPPEGYKRILKDTTSFAHYLSTLPLKPAGTFVTYSDGRVKSNRNIYDAVIDLHIGKRDLHQCADAVIRLRAEYLYQAKKFDSIYFNFTNGFKADYVSWKQGNRIIVNGNQVSWKLSSQASDSYQSFWKFLETVFSYAGTASLEKELKPISVEEMQIGDVFIKGGFPGHAVIIVDMAIHSETKEKLFLLAQSYMPAQEIQVLKNPNCLELSPWYSIDIGNSIITPEWKFKKEHLKRF